jgi:tRNA-2-methylthio-N6-dimethylallyladenosine synthase
VASYLELVARLRAAIPGISLTTDVIVGFCGETEAQFEATLGLLRTVGYDTVYAAAFSPRPGTPAARLPDDVPPAEKRRRLTTLLDVQEELGLAHQRAWLGRSTEVLVEAVRPARTHEHGDSTGHAPTAASATGEGTTWLSGRNRENRLVHVAGSPDLVGSLVTVAVDHAGPYALRGRLA